MERGCKTGLEHCCRDATEEVIVCLKSSLDFPNKFAYYKMLSQSLCVLFLFASWAWDELKHVRQAVGFLVEPGRVCNCYL